MAERKRETDWELIRMIYPDRATPAYVVGTVQAPDKESASRRRSSSSISVARISCGC